jgi:predicted alpha/beta-fold hydrolase
MVSKELEPPGFSHSNPIAPPDSPNFLGEVARALASKPFRPHPLFGNGHAQTLAAYTWPRRYTLRRHRADEKRLFMVAPSVQMLALCAWQRDRHNHPTLVLVHGLEGSSESIYMLGTTHKAFSTGLNVIRLNLRNCGGTEHLTPTLYNSGLSQDLRAVVRELIEVDKLRRLFLAGFSMAGNMALKFAGEEGDRAPRELLGVCAISPSVDLAASADAIERRENWLYQQQFVRSLRRRMRQKHKLYPDRYDTTDLHLIRTVRDFDERFTTVDGGFASAADYYARSSALTRMGKIRVPTLVIHARDDPFIPFQPLLGPEVAENPYILVLAPPQGGHVGFVGREANGEDRFWAENRIVEFCRLVGELKSLPIRQETVDASSPTSAPGSGQH